MFLSRPIYQQALCFTTVQQNNQHKDLLVYMKVLNFILYKTAFETLCLYYKKAQFVKRAPSKAPRSVQPVDTDPPFRIK